MKFEVAQNQGRVYLTFEDESLLKVFMSDVEDLVKSAAYAGNFERAKDYIDMLLILRKAHKEMKEAKDDTLQS